MATSPIKGQSGFIAAVWTGAALAIFLLNAASIVGGAAARRATAEALADAEARLILSNLEPVRVAAKAFANLASMNDDPQIFHDHALRMVGENPVIRRFVLADDGKLVAAYPRGAAFQAGRDLAAEPATAADLAYAKANDRPVLTVPISLAEGQLGFGLAYPVYGRDAAVRPEILGFASAVFSLDGLLAASGLNGLEAKGYAWSLRAGDPSAETLPLAASAAALPPDPASAAVVLVDKTWTLRLAPLGGWGNAQRFLAALAFALVLGAGTAYAAAGYRAWVIGRARLTANLTAEVATRQAAEARLRAALAEKELLLRETHHRVKNNLAIIESIVALQGGEARNTRFADAFSQLQKRIHSIALIHDKLYRGSDLGGVSARTYINDLLESIIDGIAADVAPPEAAIDDLAIPAEEALPIGLILTELYTNAIKYGGDGRVSVEFRRAGDRIVLAVANAGPPPPPDYRDLPGLGLRLVDALAGQLGGVWRAEAGPPTRFLVDFPAFAPD